MNNNINMVIDIREFESMLCDEILRNHIDIVTLVDTGWQVHGVNAWLKQNAGGKSIIVLIPDYPTTRRTSKQDYNIPHGCNVKFVLLSGFYKRKWYYAIYDHLRRLSGIISEGRFQPDNNITILTNHRKIGLMSRLWNNKEFQKQVTSDIFLVDPGVDAYQTMHLGHNNNYISRHLFRLMENFLISHSSIADSIVENYIFTESQGLLIKNDAIIQNYRSSLNLPEKSNQSVIVLLNGFKFAAGQFQCMYNKYVTLIKQLQIKDGEVYLKSHPQDKSELENLLKYNTGVDTLPQRRSMESLINESKPQAVVGVDSMALLTLAGIYDIEAYTIGDQVLECFPGKEAKDIEDFVSISRHIVNNYQLKI